MKLESINDHQFETELKELCETFGEDYREVRKLFTESSFNPYGYVDDLNDQTSIDIDDCVLTFSEGNRKVTTSGSIIFSLPAGYTCPFADKCKSLANRYGKEFTHGSKIVDKGDFRCYAASTEVQYKDVRKNRWSNYDLLKAHGSTNEMADLIERSLVHKMRTYPVKIVRVHESGDFFSQAYFDAWMLVARKFPRILFYAYTKSLPFWKKRKSSIPTNFNLIASEGGKMDELISKEDFRKAVVVQDQGEAIRRNLNIDVNDFLAAFGREDFALLIHGIQPKGSQEGKNARANRQIIKDAAKKLNVSPFKVAQLVDDYIDGLR